jgi:lysophospholipase L1-like esterase
MSPNRPRESRWRKGVFALFTVFFVLGASEGLLRLTIPEAALLLSWEREDGLLLYRSRTYVEGPADPAERARWRRGALETRPNAQTHHKDGPHPWTVQTNAQGLRTADHVPRQRTTDRRFLALGDSWMFGVSATQGKSTPAQLEQMLPARLGVGTVEVVNGGIPGANAWHMLRRWHHLVGRMALDGLVLGLPHNAPDADVPAKRRAWYAQAREAPMMPTRLYLVLRRLLLPLGRPHYPDLLTTPKNNDAKPDLHLSMTIADLRAIAADAQQRGIPVWLVLWPNDMNEALGGHTNLKRWSKPLAQLPMTGHGLTERSCWGHKDTWHPSEAGYAAIASVVADLLAGASSAPGLLEAPLCSATGENGPGL